MLACDGHLEVAIIGGGITGLTLALGLLRRGVKFTIYERARELRELGAGIGFTLNAERAMLALDPRIHQGFRKVAVQNNDDWFRYVDGSQNDCGEPECLGEHLWLKKYLGERGFEGCRRSDFLRGLVSLLPQDSFNFGKNLVSIEDAAASQKVILGFTDGTTESADVVIGCDGIRSRTRQIMFSTHHPECQPSYAQKFAFRSLVPMDRATAALGHYKTSTRFMYLGPDAHVLTFPVANGTMMNVVAFVTDLNPWPGVEDGDFTAPATKREAIQAFATSGPTIRMILSLLPEELDKWAIFDMYDHPVPCFAKDRVCLAGDAAHAASPHHGAGAGCGIEDSLALAELLAKVNNNRLVGADCGAGLVQDALLVYNQVRYERAQWLVRSSRIVGNMYEWQDADVGSDPEKFVSAFEERCHRIWDYDVGAMVSDALSKLAESRASH